MKKDIEHSLQVCCVHWFRLQYPQYATLLFAVPNGGARNAITAGKLKAEGVVRIPLSDRERHIIENL